MKYSIRRVTEWIILNGVIAYFAYIGFVNDIQYAENLFKFVIWFSFVVTLLCVISEEVTTKLNKKGKAVPRIMSLGYDMAIALFLASLGMFFYATLVVIQMFLYDYIYNYNKDE